MRLFLVVISSLVAAGCAPHRAPVVFDMRPAVVATNASEPADAPVVSYASVMGKSAAILGCNAAPESPVCMVGLPTPEEDSAFIAEGVRLSGNADARCRRLGEAIVQNEPRVLMYPKALVKTVAGERLYGLGHTYEISDVWLVRIARRIDDLNDRTLEEKTRTLRHEMSHTIGATETPGSGWTAEDYATRCG